MGSEPKVVWLPGDVRSEVHLGGEDTGGALCLIVDHPPPGWRLATHRHGHEAETIHVLEGRFDVVLDGQRRGLGAGQTVHIPAGVPHGGGNVGPDTGKRIVIFSPAGIERLFLEIGASEPGQPADVPEILAAATRYGFVFT